MAEDGDGKQHEVAADADQPPLGRTGDVERLPVERHQRVNDPLHRPDMALGTAFRGNGATIEWFSHVLIDEETLDGACHASRIEWQSIQSHGLAARGAEARLARV